MRIVIKSCPHCEEFNGVHACIGIDGVEHSCESCAWQMQCGFRVCNLNYPAHEELCSSHKAVARILQDALPA